MYLQVIRGAIDEFQKKNETFKLASKELNVEEPVSLIEHVLNRCSDVVFVFILGAACFDRQRNLVDEPLVGSGTTK